MNSGEKKRFQLLDHMALIGFGLAMLYWLIEALVYVMLHDGTGFMQRLVGPGFNDLLPRLLVLSFFAIFGSHAQYTINQRRIAEAAMRISEEKYRTIIEGIEDGYYEVSGDGRLQFCNSALANITGQPKPQVIHQPIATLLGAENARKLWRTFERLSREETEENELSWSFKRQDGSEHYLETSISLIRGSRGAVEGFRGLLRDVTRRKLAEAMYREKLAAEAASRSKSEFLANMSHEIRTPLNSIIGLIELTLDSELPPEQREDLETVLSAAHSLLALINDILDFSKIEAGRLELESIPFNIRDFLGESLRIIAAKAHEKGLELVYSVHKDVPPVVTGDPSRLRQIVLNLVGNAVKFTEKGEVVVSVRCENSSDSPCHLLFSVRDTGIGIPRQKHENIFGAFEQADGSTTRRFGGTGLGLAVSRQLVALMGGRIWVESPAAPGPDGPGENTAGPGSTFRFTARFAAPSAREAGETIQPAADLSRLKALVVDDNNSSLETVMGMLRDWGISPSGAATLEAAETAIASAEHDARPFDILLLDAAMPPSDSLSLVPRAVEKRPSSPCKIIVMTPSLKVRSRIESEGLDVAAVIAKPVRPSDLLDAIVKTAAAVPSGLETPRPQPDEPVPAGGRALKILVAEDTSFNQKFIRRLLERWGHEAVIVANGAEAVAAFTAGSFDLVLMDVQMPEMDGFEATGRIRGQEKEKGGHIPIIAMTAHAMKGDRERCLAAGMDDYVPKPISSEALLKSIRALASAGGEPGGEKEAVQLNHRSVLDESALLRAFDNDRMFLKEIIDMFTADYPGMLKEIERAIQAGDAGALQRTAHALKGMLGNFHARSPAEKAYTLEKMGRETALENSREVYEQLAEELVRVERTLEKLAGNHSE